MASRSPPLSKRGRREDDNDESRCQKKLEKGKEPAAKDADEEPLLDDSKFGAELLRSAFRNLEGLVRPSISKCIMMCTRTRP
jgi:hypothetical protein